MVAVPEGVQEAEVRRRLRMSSASRSPVVLVFKAIWRIGLGTNATRANVIRLLGTERVLKYLLNQSGGRFAHRAAAWFFTGPSAERYCFGHIFQVERQPGRGEALKYHPTVVPCGYPGVQKDYCSAVGL